MENAFPLVSIVIVNMNGKHHLKECLPTIVTQSYPNFEVIICDNNSTDGSVEFIGREYPSIKIIANHQNLGYAAANNIGFTQTKGNLIVVLNPDTKVSQNWLAPLVEAINSDLQICMVAPKIMLFDLPDQINACGNQITYTGLTFCRGLAKDAGQYPEREFIAAVSGAAFMIKKEALNQIGGFDESYFMYYEDTDLSLRALLAGYRILYEPNSIVYHKYAFRFSPLKCFYQERNRYISLIKTFRWATLVLLLPSLLFSELIAWGYIIFKGPDYIKSKLNSYSCIVSHRKEILISRKSVQAARKVKDREILARFDYHLVFDQTVRPKLARFLGFITTPAVFLLGNIGRLLIMW
jgi:GT2 family glycosyltransferase